MRKRLLFMLVCIVSIFLVLGAAVAEKGPTAAQIEKQITATYNTALANYKARAGANIKSFKGQCGDYVLEQLKALKIGYKPAGSSMSWTGYKVVGELQTNGITNYGYTQIKYGKDNPLSEIVKANNGEPVYNIVVSMTKDGSQWGHVYFVHAIINNTVYWSESSSYGKGKVVEGAVLKTPISHMEGKTPFQGSAYHITGAVHFTKEGAGAKKVPFNVSALLDGTNVSNFADIGTMDVYINNKLVADDVTEYNAQIPWGATYKIDVTCAPYVEYTGGTLSGTVGENGTDVLLQFKHTYPMLKVSALVDDTSTTSSLKGIATFDVYIQGELKASQVSEYAVRWPAGYSYSIRNIVAAEGYQFLDYSSGVNGSMGSTDNNVELAFSSKSEYVEWMYANRLPSGVSSDEYEIQYQSIYSVDQTTSPGDGWTNTGNVGTTYEDSGNVYSSLYPLATSDTRVMKREEYYHVCSGSTGEKINYSTNSTYVHVDFIFDVSTVTVAGTYTSDYDSNVKYYKLKWKSNGNWAYCGESGMCSGPHTKRSCYWYHRYYYQDRVSVPLYRYQRKDLWRSSIDSSASDYTVRYRVRLGDIDAVTFSQKVYELKVGEKLPASIVGYGVSNGVAIDPVFYLETDKTDIAQYDGSNIVGVTPGIAQLFCIVEAKYGGYTTSTPIVVRSATDFTLPAGLTSIEAEAFTGLTVQTVDLRQSKVTSIGARAFANCSKLTIVFCPDTLTMIADDAFTGCKASLTLVCESFNTAAQYAVEHSLPYCILK